MYVKPKREFKKPLLMKFFTTLITALIFCLGAKAQCDAPIIENWEPTGESSFSIEFNAPANAEEYELHVYGEYGNSLDFGIETGEVNLDGNVQQGSNTIEVNVYDILDPEYDNHSNYFYSAELSLICENGETSATNHFYLSDLSLLGNSQYDFGDLIFSPMEVIGEDGEDGVYESNVTITPADIPDSGVEDISVFFDIGDTIISTLKLEIISPEGTVIDLTGSTIDYNFSRGMSVLFQDGNPEFGIDTDSTLIVSYDGVYSPNEPLVDLEGESMVGEWTFRVSSIESEWPYIIPSMGSIVFGTGLLFNGNPCESILAGETFYDQNSNGVHDEDEPVFADAMIYNSITQDTSIVNSEGHFNICSSSGTGELSLINTPEYFQTSNIELNLSAGDDMTDIGIALTPIPGMKDLEVDITNYLPDRPGFDNLYYVEYENIGTECVSNAMLNISFDESMDILATNSEDATINGNSVDLDLGEVCPQENGTLQVDITVHDTVSIGSVLDISATITPTADDENPVNNSLVYDSEVVGSYDPNDKQVSETVIGPSFMTDEKALKYKVRFQNTGNFYAERVVITDTIDSQLRKSTFKVLSHSHPMEVSWDGNVVYFEFDNIFLPDSTTDEEGSHGHVRYEIMPELSVSDGDEIENTAYIYFDFNPPIVTNTVSTLFDTSLGLEEYEFEANVYPNPASSILTIEWPQDATIEGFNLLDITGKTLRTVNSNSNSQRLIIDVEELPAGTYLLKASGKSNVKPAIWMKR